ncbi:MAG: hypothetical protein PV344_05775 [Anaplasma sp.]|nr:hypothetical protein [Anaplasma sp.]
MKQPWQLGYCKRQNFREDLISRILRIEYDSRKIGPANNSGYVNITEASFDSRKLEPANNFKLSALARFAEM